jgi:membrane dipeptidase
MIFDAHGDILTDLYMQAKNKDSFKKRHLDLYKKGGVTHSIFVNFTEPDTKDDQLFNKIFDNAFIDLKKNCDIFKVCLDYKDMEISLSEGKIGVIIGMEGIAQLKDTNHLRELYSKGVRHASLTWNEENKYASGLDNLNTRGLTDKGKEVLAVMEELGMLVDLAHLNEKSFFDVVNNTKNPIIISHGNTKAICNHRRNYTDEQLMAIKNSNGVIGICGIGDFIAKEVEFQNVKTLVKHIDHAVKTIGIDHVGLGFDFCYYLGDESKDNDVDGLLTIADVPNIFIELKRIGYSNESIEKIKHLNFERVIKEILK